MVNSQSTDAPNNRKNGEWNQSKSKSKSNIWKLHLNDKITVGHVALASILALNVTAKPTTSKKKQLSQICLKACPLAIIGLKNDNLGYHKLFNEIN